MLYRFKSRAAADLLMLEPVGRRLLEAIGREPAAQGIFESEHLPELIRRLEQAVQADEAHWAAAEAQAAAQGQILSRPEVSLRQRLWPMREMMRRCQAEQQPITWGV